MGDSLEQYRGRIGNYALRITSLESSAGASSKRKKSFFRQSQEKEKVFKEIREENIKFFSSFLTSCVPIFICLLLVSRVDVGSGSQSSISSTNPQFNLPAESIKGWSTTSIALPFLPCKLQCCGDIEANPGPSNSGSTSDVDGSTQHLYFDPRDDLKVGTVFEGRQKVMDDMKLYCDNNFFPLIRISNSRGDLANNKYGRIVYKCTHGHQRKSTATSDRPFQKVNFTGCKAFVNINQNKKDDWTVTKLDLNHTGHVLNKEIYYSYPHVRKLSQDDLDYVQDLVAARAAPRNIATALSRRTKQTFKPKDAQNIIRKVRQTLPDSKNMKEHLTNILVEGGDVQYSLDEDSGEVNVLYVQTKLMRDEVAHSRPYLWQADTTFNTNKEGYKLMTLTYKSITSGKYEIHALIFLATENHDNVRLGLNFFHQGLPYTEDQLGGKFIFVLDKDFDYITIFKELFTCEILLCWVHQYRTMKDKVLSKGEFLTDGNFTKLDSSEIKDVLTLFIDVRNSNSEAEYDQKRRLLLNATKDLYVKPTTNKKPLLFHTYFTKNWDVIEKRKMWVKYHRSQFAIRGTNDTNAAESMFRKIKHFERLFFGKRKPSITEFLPHLVEILDDEQRRKNQHYQNKRLVIHHDNPRYKEALEKASWELNRVGLSEFHRIILWFEERKKFMTFHDGDEYNVIETYGKINYTGRYEVTENDCSCTAKKTYLICRHTLFFREENRLPAFDVDMFPESFLIKQNRLDQSSRSGSGDDSNNAEESDEELEAPNCPASPGVEYVADKFKKKKKSPSNIKFNRAFEITSVLPEILCQYDDEIFSKLEVAMKMFVNLMRDGVSDDLLNYLMKPTEHGIHCLDCCQGHQILDEAESIGPNSIEDSCHKESSASVNNREPPSNYTPLRQRERQKPGQIFDVENSLREVPEIHRQYMTFDCIIKGVKGNGACFYLAVCQELWGSTVEWEKFRMLCHDYIVELVPQYYYPQMVGSFPRTLVVGVGKNSSTLQVENSNEYLRFLKNPKSLVSFVELEFDMQIVCDVFNVNLSIFYYSNNRSIPTEIRQGWRKFYPNPPVALRSKDRISDTADHTIFLYYQTDCHYETLISRPTFAPNNQSQARENLPSDQGVSYRYQNIANYANPDHNSDERNKKSKNKSSKTSRPTYAPIVNQARDHGVIYRYQNLGNSTNPDNNLDERNEQPREKSSKSSTANQNDKSPDRSRVERSPSQPSDCDTVGSDISLETRTKSPLDILFRKFVPSRGRPKQGRYGGPANPGRRVSVDDFNAGGTVNEKNQSNNPTKKRGRPVGSKNKPKQPGMEYQKTKKNGPGRPKSSVIKTKTVPNFIEELNDSNSVRSDSVTSRTSRADTAEGLLNRHKYRIETISDRLDAIAESIYSPEVSPQTSISSSRITRSMSARQQQRKTFPSSQQGTSGDAESNEMCLTCHFELDGRETEVRCPKCQEKIHLDCLRGDGCHSLPCR